MGRFVIKHIDNRKPQVKVERPSAVVDEINDSEAVIAEDKKKISDVMTTSEKVAMAQSVLGDANAKRIKKDKGLIERTESSKTILTEDNKELLND